MELKFLFRNQGGSSYLWFMKLARECITEIGRIPVMSRMLLCLCCCRVDRNLAGARGDCRSRKS
jgi:hypothetical protein